MFPWYDVHTMSKLKVHIVSKIVTCKISFILIFLNSHLIDFEFKNKTIYINHEYEIDS